MSDVAFLQQLKDLSGGKVEFETIPVSDLNSMTSAGAPAMLKPRFQCKRVLRLIATTLAWVAMEPRPEHTIARPIR